VVLARPGHKPEFDAWRWAGIDELIGLIVPFKRGVYEQVLAEFAPLAVPVTCSTRCASATCPARHLRNR
jgi:putative (di)nucleoside polyphosphate hydrolase